MEEQMSEQNSETTEESRIRQDGGRAVSNNELTREELIEKVNKLTEQLSKNDKLGLVFERQTEDAILNRKLNVPVIIENKVKHVANGGNDNLLLIGDNFDSLTNLLQTHRGRVNVIEIDPPYNTGNKDFWYHDDYVNNEDTFRHSKWLSFMEPRLSMAKNLLSDDGIVVVHIDYNEFAELKMLMDRVYGQDNLIQIVSWHKGYGKNESRFFRNTTEYVLVYAKNMGRLIELDYSFRAGKEGYSEVKQIIDDFKDSGGVDSAELEKIIKEFYKNNPHLKGISSYYKVEDRTLRLYSSVTMEKPADPCYFYDVMHPVSNKAVKIPKKGWNRPESSMKELLANNEVLFGKDESTIPRRKYYLDEMSDEAPKDLIINSEQGGALIKQILGEEEAQFSFPKPLSLLKFLLRLYPKKDSLVLDFFAGSGTTGHAVLELNKEDGGNRKFILCTNDEAGIGETVTYERIKRVITGKDWADGKEHESYEASLRYYNVNHVKRDDVMEKNLLDSLEDTVKIKENTFTDFNRAEGYNVFTNKESDKYVAILKNRRKLFELAECFESLAPVELVIYNNGSTYIDEDCMQEMIAKGWSVSFIEYPQEFINDYKFVDEKLGIKNMKDENNG